MRICWRRAPKPEAEVAPLGKVLKAIEAKPGQTTTTRAKQLDGDQSAIIGLLKEAETDGTVRREGERRATRCFMANGREAAAA